MVFSKQKKAFAALSVLIKQKYAKWNIEHSDCDSLTSFCECSQKKKMYQKFTGLALVHTVHSIFIS